MRIAAVDLSLAAALRDMGHEVLCLELKPGINDVSRELEKSGFAPDLIIQQETLGPRKLLKGLEGLSCPKVFWSIDTHLNAWWHGIYGRFFDVVFTTQDHWIPALEKSGLENVQWLPWFGASHAFKPYSERDCPVGFVGRLTEQRMVRRWMADYLRERVPFILHQSVNSRDLLSFYSRIRLVPNEAILGELNFRLFEAASAGCLVLTPKTRAGLHKIFDAGREVLVYEDALELVDLLKHYMKNTQAAEDMGRAAHTRISEQHLPEHRAQGIIESVSNMGSSAAPGRESDMVGLLQELSDAGMLKVDSRILRNGLFPGMDKPGGATRFIRFLASQKDYGTLTAVLVNLLEEKKFIGQADLDFTGSAAALHIHQFDLAKAFWYRRLESKGRPWSRPETPAALLVNWAEELKNEGRVSKSGFPFDPAAHLPSTALDCLVLAAEAEGPGSSLDRKLSRLLADMEGGDHLRLGVMSDLSLRNSRDWRIGLELGLLNMRCFRFNEGLEELRYAESLAREAGKQESFRRILAGKDGSGRISASLAEYS